MNTTTTFETFSLDVTKEHAEEQIAYALKRDGIITFDTIRSTEGLLQFCARLGLYADTQLDFANTTLALVSHLLLVVLETTHI